MATRIRSTLGNRGLLVFVNVMTEMQELIAKSLRDFKEGSIVKGRVLEIRPREVLVDIGYKSEGVIPASEFDDMGDVEVGDEVEVLLEKLENEDGMVVLSKEKAAHKQNWDKIVKVFEGDGLIKGKVKAVVKGGLTVNIGVEAFLPGSQIDIVPPKDLQQFVGNTYDFKIVKINDERKNVVLSRREIIEQERAEKRIAIPRDGEAGRHGQRRCQKPDRFRCVYRSRWDGWLASYHRYDLGTTHSPK